MMVCKIKHKILAVGGQLMSKRLSHKLDSEQFTLIHCPDPQAAAAILEQDEFDLVIVDNLIHGAEALCRELSLDTPIPVTLLMQEKPLNWKSLGLLSVDGYLPDSGSNLEFTARLKAYLRPKAIPNKTIC
jgi:DNA-binding response OmpR family regulator